jgi:hypothetical protein
MLNLVKRLKRRKLEYGVRLTVAVMSCGSELLIGGKGGSEPISYG